MFSLRKKNMKRKKVKGMKVKRKKMRWFYKLINKKESEKKKEKLKS